MRATVLDAFSLNYRITLAEEGCFDRSQSSHAINLCDMNAKYADVVKTSEVLEFFDTLPSGQYELPKGCAPAPLDPDQIDQVVIWILSRPQLATGYAVQDIGLAAEDLWPCK